MRKICGVVAIIAMATAVASRAEVKPAAKGPDEDGTKAALVKIAGEGMLDSQAYRYLTELSDDVGSRVTGSPDPPPPYRAERLRWVGRDQRRPEDWTATWPR